MIILFIMAGRFYVSLERTYPTAALKRVLSLFHALFGNHPGIIYECSCLALLWALLPL